VAAARATYRLPYNRATMTVARSGETVTYPSSRTSPDGAPAELAVD
jgi:uncharacterized protein YqjF (DUF2071 family)